MVNVRQSMEAEGHGFQVFLSFQEDSNGDEINKIENDAQSTFGSAAVRSITVENKGADIGPYLRQLQILGREPADKHHDIFLKIHTKSNGTVRRDCLRHLCGTAEQIRKLYTRLRQTKSVGMVGPPGNVGVAPWVQMPSATTVKRVAFGDTQTVWSASEVVAMRRAWHILHPPMTFEKGAWNMARIIANSFYWARQEAVMYDVILGSIDMLLGVMPYGYRHGSCCQTPHALERLMPTMAVTIQGLDVVSVEDVVH
jgi:hypothetical protein